MKKKLAIIGASYLQLPLVEKAVEMGIETHCFAWEEGAICKNKADYFYPISIIEKDQILEKCQEIGIDGICTIASDLAVVAVNYVSTKMGLKGNRYEDVGIQTNKYKMREALKILDANSTLKSLQELSYIPKFQKISALSNQVKDVVKFPQIIKPVDRSGSRGVTKVYNEDERKNAIERAFDESLCKEVIIEEFVEGSEISVESISYEGKHHVLQITDKVTTGEPYFVELEHHQPSTLAKEIKEKIYSLVPKALNALHIKNGASHTEIKVDYDGNLRIIEIGARMGGDFIGSDLVQLSTGYDFLKGVIQVALGEFEEPIFSQNHNSGVYFLSAETPNIKRYIDNCKKYPEIVKVEITNPDLHHIMESADRSGYFIYQSDKKFI